MIYDSSLVSRTAFKYVQDQDDPLSFGNGLPHGINQVCPCCKAGSTTPDGKIIGDVEQIRDSAELKPWTDFFKTFEYKAYKCFSCGYKWCWYKVKD